MSRHNQPTEGQPPLSPRFRDRSRPKFYGHEWGAVRVPHVSPLSLPGTTVVGGWQCRRCRVVVRAPNPDAQPPHQECALRLRGRLNHIHDQDRLLAQYRKKIASLARRITAYEAANHRRKTPDSDRARVLSAFAEGAPKGEG